MSLCIGTIIGILQANWALAESFLTPVLGGIDPTLLQNIILGILALFVPIGVGILSFFFEERSKGEIQSNLELYILLRQILKAKQLALFSIAALILLALYSVSFVVKLLGILFALFYVIWMIAVPSRNIWQWFFENTTDFSLHFLKGLSVTKDAGTLVKSWQALWLGDSKGRNEREYTLIFIGHVDDAIKSGEYGLAVELSQMYVNNIEKRDRFSLGYEILPKIFEWHEGFWEREQSWLNRENLKERVQQSISQKHFPTFKKWISKILNKSYSRPDYFWNWHFFQQVFFPAVAKALMTGWHDSYEFFTAFKKYIEEAEAKLEKIEDKDRNQRWWNYIMGLFGSFCPIFFNTIDGAPGNYDIWHHYYPGEWKITSGNAKKRIPRVVLHEFLQWSQQRIFKDNDTDYDKDLTEVVGGIFPNVHHGLFPAFLMLLASAEIKYAVQKVPSFFMINTGISWSGEKSEEDIQQMVSQQDRSQKEETVSVILDYFSHWNLLKPYKDDLSEKELADWDGYPEEKRKTIVTRIRNKKLQKALDELISDEVVALCKDSEKREFQRKIFVELIELLLAEINKTA